MQEARAKDSSNRSGSGVHVGSRPSLWKKDYIFFLRFWLVAKSYVRKVIWGKGTGKEQLSHGTGSSAWCDGKGRIYTITHFYPRLPCNLFSVFFPPAPSCLCPENISGASWFFSEGIKRHLVLCPWPYPNEMCYYSKELCKPMKIGQCEKMCLGWGQSGLSFMIKIVSFICIQTDFEKVFNHCNWILLRTLSFFLLFSPQSCYENMNHLFSTMTASVAFRSGPWFFTVCSLLSKR